MEKDLIKFLESHSGEIILAKAGGLKDAMAMREYFESVLLQCEKSFIPFLTTLVILRREGVRKFSRSGEMLFTRRGYEQATNEAISQYKATLVPEGASVLVACSGIGGEALFLSRKGLVTLLDSDPVMSYMGSWNIHVYEGSPLNVYAQTLEDFLVTSTEKFDAIFLDPDRREEDKRFVRLKDYSPNVLNLFRRLFALSSKVFVKVSPLIREELLVLPNLKVIHYIEEGGELKEVMLEFEENFVEKPLKKIVSIHNSINTYESYENEKLHISELKEIPTSGFILEPSPAVIKSGLITELVADIDAYVISKRGALLYVPHEPKDLSPWFKVYPIIDAQLYKPAIIKKKLLELGIQKCTIKKRYFPLEPSEIRKQLKIKEGMDTFLIATTLAGTKRVLFITKPANIYN